MVKKRVAVAMSGGVDSSVAAAKLLTEGYDVFGVTMLLFNAEDSDKIVQSNALSDAKKVADQLGIAHYVLDLRDYFKKQIIDYFVQSYARGITPNPCVLCNEVIKFGVMYDEALKLGADYVATGHYAKVLYNSLKKRYELYKGNDLRKDQSYVLYHMKQNILAHILFPVGDIDKRETRIMAEKFGLPVYSKPESQDICFIPNNDHLQFLKKYVPGAFQPGEIVDVAGNVLGMHKGLPAYTVGQRKGLGIAVGSPIYVVALDVSKNRLIVGPEDKLFAKTVKAEDYSFLDCKTVTGTFKAYAKIRYASPPAACTVYPEGASLRVEFEVPQRAITPGQSIVFYEGDRLLGGAIITNNPLDGED